MSGRDAVTEVPPDRWDVDALFDPDPGVAGQELHALGRLPRRGRPVRRRASSASRRARRSSMDPQQRLLLEVAWEALEHAGIAPDALWPARRPACSSGMTGTEYADLALQGGILADVDAYFASGVAQSVAAGRLAYVFDLHGPAVAVDTACSSSLRRHPPGLPVAAARRVRRRPGRRRQPDPVARRPHPHVAGPHDVVRGPLQDVRRRRRRLRARRGLRRASC